MNKNVLKCASILCMLIINGVVLGDSILNYSNRSYCLSLVVEQGFIGVYNHTIQFGSAGTKIDYVNEANQNVLYPFTRFSTELKLGKRNSIIFLYQPLSIKSEALLNRDIIVDNQTFSSNTVVKFTYDFPFYRLSYLYSIISKPNAFFSIGISLQVRNARIIFESGDGAYLRRTSNIGPVPILKIKGEKHFDSGYWVGIEADGFYASSAFFNGANFKFVGSVYDVSLRSGITLKNGFYPFINIRILGGGAEGTSKYPQEWYSDGYTSNWLETVSITLGISIR